MKKSLLFLLPVVALALILSSFGGSDPTAMYVLQIEAGKQQMESKVLIRH
jgi:hypothetical protein